MSKKINKIIIIFFLTVFSILIIMKYSISFFKNEIINIIKSDRFDVFLINVLDQKLEKIANSELPENKKIFYKENIKKIFLKIKELN